ncbi:MAG: DUF2141 domain-containing protein [Bacteroidales bacterium]|nr:DUF2141 domain-containing protein [Bacteroidales bacterium]MBN2818369.1 DUF2141 domain-containing protein [Bacteroidales bacterium]
MWIALFIIGLYAWLFKRRKKTIKQDVTKLSCLFLVFTSSVIISKAQSTDITISGEIITTLQNKGKIVVFLVDFATFKKPLTGLDTVFVNPKDKIVYYTFKPCKKGSYGIRCFQDLNNNGILDKGMFGPAEPYGFSWKSGRKFPFDFTDISFTANSNKFITIKMED